MGEVPFILSNRTYHPLNPRWASDGVFPLGLQSGEALQKTLDAFGGNPEVSLFLDKYVEKKMAEVNCICA